MAWGIGGDAGAITHKLQQDDLRTQLLQQELAQRMQQFQGQQALAQQRLDLDKQQEATRTEQEAQQRRAIDNNTGVREMDMMGRAQREQDQATQQSAALDELAKDPRMVPFMPAIKAGLLKTIPEGVLAPKPEQDYRVTTAGPNGPIETLKSASELKKGVPGYRAPERPSSSAPVGALTEEGLTAAAMQYATTGSMPPLGMSNSKIRTEIINKAAALFPGINPGANAGDFSANKGSLTNITKQLDGISAYEKTALKNLDVFLTQAKGIKDTGSPYLNTPVRKLDERLLGSPQMTAFQTARMVVLPEFARIITNPNLTGILSDSARKEIEELVKGDATLPQIEAAAKVLKQDAANRRESLSVQRDAIQGRMRGSQGGTSPEPASDEKAPPKKRFTILPPGQ